MAYYEVWLTDDAGRRIQLLKDLTYFSYTRSVNNLGSFQMGMPFNALKLNPFFLPDWRAEIWRSPADGVQMRLEDVYLLRKPVIYQRTDGVKVIQFYGRNGWDLLNRRSVIQRGGTTWATKTATADNVMKAIVREQMLYGSALNASGVVDNTRGWPQNEFSVQGDNGLGPTITVSFADKSVLDTVKDIKKLTQQLYLSAPTTYRKIYFDVTPISLSTTGNALASPLGWEFRTYADLRGGDRTGGIVFSLENENIKEPSYSENRLEEVTSVVVRGNGAGGSQIVTTVDDATRVYASRWNRIEKVINASNESTANGLTAAGNAELFNGKPREELAATILNRPGGSTAPRSLYGVDWDLGDLVRVDYANKQFNVELTTIYVSVDEHGQEEITGRNEVQ